MRSPGSWVGWVVCIGLGSIVACGGSEEPGDDDGGSSGASSGDNGSGSSSGGSSSGGSSGTNSSSSSSGGSSSGASSSGDASTPLRPEECQLMLGGTLQNGPQLTPTRYGAQPTFRSTVESPAGETALPDQLLVRVDAATGPGTYSLTVAGQSNCYERGAQCVYLNQDIFDNAANKFFVAVAGQITIENQITTDQSQGRLEYIELREAIPGDRNVPYNAAALVDGGACLWITGAEFDTRRPDGCNPLLAESCGANRVCVAENAAGSDGTCRGSTGGGTNGAPCVVNAAGDSNCGLEYVCSHDDQRVCRRRCDLLGDDNSCPINTTCSLFGYCEPWERDPAALGESCDQAGARCGEDDRGWCFNAMDDQTPPQPLPEGKRCHPFQRSRAACPAGQELGYVDVPNDRSIGTCVPAPWLE